jgi:IrrE N-terminal-like domain
MKLYIYALSLVFAFQPAPESLCGSLSATSEFPNLPGDSVGALPPDLVSTMLSRLFDEARKSTSRSIRFTQLPPGVPNTSAVETTISEYVVALRTGLDSEERKSSVAHELSHVVLQGKGFAAQVAVPNGAPPLLKQLGFTITSCVDDALVDKMVSEKGFRPEVLNHDSVEHLRSNPPLFPADSFKDPVFRDGNALLIVCFAFRTRYPNDDIEPIWNEYRPDIVARAHDLKAQIGDIGCDDAATCLARKKHIRDVLGYPITFCNPLTGRNE